MFALSSLMLREPPGIFVGAPGPRNDSCGELLSYLRVAGLLETSISAPTAVRLTGGSAG